MTEVAINYKIFNNKMSDFFGTYKIIYYCFFIGDLDLDLDLSFLA